MIIYISENLNNKKNGGSSTSGYEFLQFLRIKHKSVVVVTLNKLNFKNKSEEFYGNRMSEIHEVVTLKRSYLIKPFTLKKIAKKIYYYLQDVFNKKNCDVSKFYEENSSENVIYVNSWSGLYSNQKITNLVGFKKVCIVRGSPESFIWQSFEKNKDVAIQNAADYLELFDNLIFVSNNGLEAWNKIFKKPIKSYYLPNSINEIDIEEVRKLSVDDAKIKLGISSNNYNIIVVGSIQKRKAQDVLLEIIEGLIKEIPNVKFGTIAIPAPAMVDFSIKFLLEFILFYFFVK